MKKGSQDLSLPLRKSSERLRKEPGKPMQKAIVHGFPCLQKLKQSWHCTVQVQVHEFTRTAKESARASPSEVPNPTDESPHTGSVTVHCRSQMQEEFHPSFTIRPRRSLSSIQWMPTFDGFDKRQEFTYILQLWRVSAEWPHIIRAQLRCRPWQISSMKRPKLPERLPAITRRVALDCYRRWSIDRGPHGGLHVCRYRDIGPSCSANLLVRLLLTM